MGTTRQANEDQDAPEQDRYRFDHRDTCRDHLHRGYGNPRHLCEGCVDARDNPPGLGPDGPFVDVSGGRETIRGRRFRTGVCEHGFMRYSCARGEHADTLEEYNLWRAMHNMQRLDEDKPGRATPRGEPFAVTHPRAPKERSSGWGVWGPLRERLVELDNLTIRKNEGYAGAEPADPWSNLNAADAWGLTGLDSALLRLQDKVSRAATLYSGRGADQVGEGWRDTMLDLAAYALIAVDLADKATGENGFGDPAP